MILYSTGGTADMERAGNFYDAVFGALGVARRRTGLTVGQVGEAPTTRGTDSGSANHTMGEFLQQGTVR